MKKNIRMLVFLIVMGLLLAWPIHALVTTLDQPAEDESLAELDKLAGDMLELTRRGDLEGAQQKVHLLANRFPNQTLPFAIRIESLNAVTQSIMAAKKSFASGHVNEEQLLWHATQVRLAIDALSHVHQPMWRSFYTSYANQMQNLLQSSVERDLSQFRAQFEENTRLYWAIKPAMSVHLPEEQMNEMEAAYDLISKEIHRNEMEWQEVREALRQLIGAMQIAFIGEDKSTIALLMHPGSPFLPIVAIVAALVLSLSYVAWKKYAGQHVHNG
ncbi:sporulation protein YpjB [Brevibacillus sp. H7]|uniref:sporulation protein YpjB n=1 Tax=Brevibacillus sp. H7 TaxID=3349138 RepID=UPI00381736E9